MKDLKEIPDKVKEGLQIVPIGTIEEAVKYVFVGNSSSNKKRVLIKKK
jgi:ATP-dependent Lon protease